MGIIELTEFIPLRLPHQELSVEDGTKIWREYSNQLSVEFPSPKTNSLWELRSNGWVGYIPVSPEIGISLKPKVKLENLFLMLEYAYRLKSFKFLKGITSCDSIAAFYQQLAKILARRVIDRARQGFYHDYLTNFDRITYLKGRMDIGYLVRAPWASHLWCHYQNHTADIIENQILYWTLHCIARSGICTEDVANEVRNAYRGLQNVVQLIPFSPQDCIARLYNRLNNDYEPLHALCRFFLEHSGPTLSTGVHSMLPFLVDMSKLFELFVSEWLAIHLPDRFFIRPQENVNIGAHGELNFKIDIVVYDHATSKPVCILDTKYKVPDKPSNTDIAQVVTYAELKECRNAILIYPKKLQNQMDEKVGEIRIRNLTFNLDGNLENSGVDFRKNLLNILI